MELLLGLLKQNILSLSSAYSKPIVAFSNGILSVHVSVLHLVICNISNFFIIIIFVILLCDQ